jgi:hypothetical protein
MSEKDDWGLELCKIMSDWFWDNRSDVKTGAASRERIDSYS